MANRSPPGPFIVGSTTERTAAAVTAASMALPPDWSTRSPAAVASGWLVAIAPLRASTAERVPRVFPAGLSPAGCCMRIEVAIIVAAAARMTAIVDDLTGDEEGEDSGDGAGSEDPAY